VEAIEAAYRREAPQVLATLIRLLGSFELAEEAVQMAFLAAAQQWPAEGVPRNPRAWLVSTGRFKAIDMLRRRKRFVGIDRTWKRCSNSGRRPHRSRMKPCPTTCCG
jgi:predicted RNA polymerase sigma factor